ncbi:2-hydroxyacid dehydrogenase [Frankia sp. CiP3]|uniref:2-hydroxyacid dehydrogenase n=1 Tax=Frankia sp. CiP3 TaxID=2880971 RepID=UPI001EF51DC6|nr:NAD(P)-dependent oxidoreductase [Frankia sp. CiP3]
MKIVVLDEVDLSVDQYRQLTELGTVVKYDDNPSDDAEIIKRLDKADVAVLGWTSLGPDVFARLPQLRLISVWATGYDYVDIPAARKHGVVVTNVPSYAGRAVAELTLGMIFALARHVVWADSSVRGGAFAWRGFRGFELMGKTLGLIGVGDIGREVARLAQCLGMRVVVHTRRMTPERAETLGVDFVPFATLLSESDVISLHVPLTEGTRLLMGPSEFAQMKSTAYLINTCRAGLVDQPALVAALRRDELAGAALDDIDFPDDALTVLPNVIITPHIGFYTGEALVRKGDVCVRNVAAFVAGNPVNVVT